VKRLQTLCHPLNDGVARPENSEKKIKKTSRKTIENKQRKNTCCFPFRQNIIQLWHYYYFFFPRTYDRSRSRYPPAGTDTRGVDRRLTRYDDERVLFAIIIDLTRVSVRRSVVGTYNSTMTIRFSHQRLLHRSGLLSVPSTQHSNTHTHTQCIVTHILCPNTIHIGRCTSVNNIMNEGLSRSSIAFERRCTVDVCLLGKIKCQITDSQDTDQSLLFT